MNAGGAGGCGSRPGAGVPHDTGGGMNDGRPAEPAVMRADRVRVSRMTQEVAL
jgi:hypothetical protein